MKMKNMIAVMSAASIAALGMSAMSFSASAADALGNAYMIGALGTEECWKLADVNAESTTAVVDGDAQYEVEWVPTAGGTDTVQFLCVCISPADGVDNFGVTTFPDLQVSLDEVWIDGVKQEGYTASAAAIDTNYFESGAGVTRIYLRDEWAGTGVSDLDGATTITQSVKVVFTVSGLGVEGTSNVTAEEPTEAPTDAPTEAPADSATEAPADDSSKADSTTTTGGSTSSTSSSTTSKGGSTTTSNAATGDAGVAAAVAALAVAGAAVMVSKKRK